jgi:tetratricopeptide (TPR) repeat protein
MKGFFERLFAIKGVVPDADKQPAAAKLNPPPDTFQPYQTGDMIVGKYEVRGVLGKGGSGIVYHIRFRETGEDFALKTFKDELTVDPAAVEAFKKEALVWVDLERHPFILPAIWVEEISHGRIAALDDGGKLVLDRQTAQGPSGRLLVVMDLVEADAQNRANLDDHLRGGTLNENQILTWGIQFCLGMEHARAHGVECHRDIKPANIMITKEGTLKISDFGLAIATESVWRGNAGRGLAVAINGGEFGLTVVQSEGKLISGTPGYIAPEICRGEVASSRSDIYSFGLVLWQMAVGSPVPPFRVQWRGDFVEYMRGVYEQQMAGRIPHLSGSLGAVIERCLRPQPAERYGTFQELRSALEQILERRTGRKFETPQFTGKTTAFWNNKGGSLAALGQHEEAIRCYDAALEIDPRSHRTWNNKGNALSALGRRDEALECFNRALKIDSGFAMAWENKGRELHILGRLDEALKCYDSALSYDSRDAGAWQKKGSLFVAMGKHAEAVACFDRALTINPRSLESLHNKGLSLMMLGNDAQAWNCFDQVLAINPQFEMAWVEKGKLLVSSGRLEDALSCFDKAIVINSTNADAHANKATSLAAIGRNEDALASCDHALKFDPQHAATWVTKGALLAATGRIRDAAVCYEKALAIDARNVVAWCGKGSALAAVGRHSEALICLDHALAIEPSNAAALFGRAISAEIEGRLSDAATSLRRFIEVAGPTYEDEIAAAKKHFADLVLRETQTNDEAAERLNNEGLVLKQRGELADALVCYDEALEMAPQRAAIWCNKGNALHAMGRTAEAFQCFDKAVALNPKDMKSWCNRGVALKALGRMDEAITAYDRALEIEPHDVKTWFNKANVFAALEKYREAMACFQKAHDFGDPNAARYVEQCRRLIHAGTPDPEPAVQSTNDAQELFAKAANLAASGRHADAVSCYENGLGLNSSNAEAWFNMGHAIGLLGRHRDVVRCCDRALKIHPNFSALWILKGLGFISMDQFDDAMTCFEKAKQLGDTSAADRMVQCRMAHAEWYFRLGSRYQQEGNHTEANACYEKGLARNPNNGVIWVNKGAALLALDRAKEAVVCFDRAIALDSNDSGAWNNKGIALMSLGQREEGAACLLKALKMRKGEREP